MKLTLPENLKRLLSKSKTAAQGDSKIGDNPYLNARRTWNEHVGGVVSSRQTWQVIGMCSMMIALAAVGGVVYVGSQSKFVPYVVEVSPTTHLPTARGPIEEASKVDQRVVEAQIADFINNARLITPDVALERQAILKVYAMLMPETAGINKMNEYLNGNPEADHFKLAETETQDIEITDILPQSDSTWQIDWLETVRDRDGTPKAPAYRMRALLTIAIIPPDSNTPETQVRANPLGVYVKDFSWSKQL